MFLLGRWATTQKKECHKFLTFFKKRILMKNTDMHFKCFVFDVSPRPLSAQLLLELVRTIFL